MYADTVEQWWKNQRLEVLTRIKQSTFFSHIEEIYCGNQNTGWWSCDESYKECKLIETGRSAKTSYEDYLRRVPEYPLGTSNFDKTGRIVLQ